MATLFPAARGLIRLADPIAAGALPRLRLTRRG